jgi:hypothetical protein
LTERSPRTTASSPLSGRRGRQCWALRPWPLAAAALLSLLAVEMGLRLLGFGRPPLLIEDRRMEYRFQPYQTLSRFGRRIAINRWGMRSPQLEPEPSPGRQRLLVLGDSIVWGGAETDQADIAVSRLQRQLGPSWELANLATPSWGPANWLGAIESFGLFGAQQVLLVISSHDATDDPSYAPLDANPNTPTRNPPLALLELGQRYAGPRLLGVLPPQLRGLIGGGGPGTAVGSTDPSGPRSTPGQQAAADSRDRPGRHPTSGPQPGTASESGSKTGTEFTVNPRRPPDLQAPLPSLEGLVSAVQGRGARLVVLQFWERGELEAGRPWPDHDRITALLQRRGVAVTQAGPILRRCAEANGKPVAALYVDPIHPYTDLGQRCLAEALAQALNTSGAPAR